MVLRLARQAHALLVIAFLLPSAPLRAEPVQFWLPVNIVARFAPGWALAVQVEPRWDDGGDADMDRVLFRPAIVCEPVKGLTLWGGYGYTEVTAKRLPDDQLLWQQAVYSFTAGGWTLAPRVRIEERFVERTDATAWRLRAHFRATHPLPHFTGWSFVGWHESFIPLNDVRGAQGSGFSQGRIFVGVQRRVSARVTIEPGYLALFNNRTAPLDDDWDHALNVGLQVRF